MRKQRLIYCAVACTMALPFTITVNAEETRLESWSERLAAAMPGKVSLNVRTRYEVFETPEVKRGGWSQRLRYGYLSEDYSGFSGMVEGETLYAMSSSRELHPLDEAGQGTEVNQLWLQYKQGDIGSLRIGRQVFTLDDHRFIGHVGWRQNMQSYDAVTAQLRLGGDVALTPIYLAQVNRVSGDRVDMDTWGVNGQLKTAGQVTLSGFFYSIRVDVNQALPRDASNDTFGLGGRGKFELQGLRFSWSASYAFQQDNSRNTEGTEFSLDYMAADLSVDVEGITLGGGFEILEGDGRNGFRTPLATVHGFNGFADVFLPITGFAQGLEDFYLYSAYTLPFGSGIPLRVTYHYFNPETGSGDYGSEWDLLASYQLSKYFALIAKYARYEADSGAVAPGAADKEMFSMELNFIY